MTDVIPPGATIGIVGGGQLGTMIAREAHRMGYRVACVDPDPDCPLARRADVFLPGAYADGAVLEALARQTDVLTIETEHIPAAGLERASQHTPVRPRPEILGIVQDRLAQRRFLAAHGFPQTRFHAVSTKAELDAAMHEIGAPGILKLRRGGYDGKGQARLRSTQDAAAAWAELGRGAAVYEAFVEFDAEVSVVVARATNGSTVRYPVAENVHRNGILHTTRVPATIDDERAAEAADIATRIAQAMDHVGVMTIEFFLAGDQILVNEIAPRIHNSGHYTAAACNVSQSEQHLRAITGNALAAPFLHTGVVMLNILGEAWAHGVPDWAAVLAEPRAQLHLYDKKEARPGRKMGHLLILDADADEAMRTAEALHARLTAPHAVDLQASRKGG